MNTTIMDCTPLTSQFSIYLNSITSGSNPEEINEAWQNLIKLSPLLKPPQLKNSVKFIVKTNLTNVRELPKLLEYFADIVDENPFEIDTTIDKNCYAIFFGNIIERTQCSIDKLPDISLFADVVAVLKNHSRVYVPNCQSGTKFCEAIVLSLARFHMPYKSNKITEFKEKSQLISDYLMHVICSCRKGNDYQALHYVCLETLHKLMSNTESNQIPGAALVTLLGFVEKTLIPKAVDSIISKSASDVKLQQVLTVLCSWLSQWLNENTLSLWIAAFFKGLAKEQRHTVLLNIIDNFLKIMINRMKLPHARNNCLALIHLMVITISTPKSFHKVIRDIEVVMKILGDENTERSKQSAQSIVDCTKALMIRFPGYPMYESLEKSMPVQPRMEVVERILKDSLCIEDNQIVQESYYNNGQVGLTNLGNTCYMNSVLQALAMTRQFCQQVITYNDLPMGRNIVLRELQKLFALLSYSKRISLAPVDFLRVSRPAYFTPGQQQDSSEFLCHLLDILYEQETSNSTKPKNGQIIINDETLSTSTRTNVAELTFPSREEASNAMDSKNINSNHENTEPDNEMPLIPSTSLVHRVFGGESNTTYQCARCHTSSHNNDKFRDLQLSFPEEMPENQQISVQDLINYYLTPEKLTGDNKYHCAKCNDLCDAQRIIKILRAPAHLILTLKHFHYDPASRLKAKLRHKVLYNETIQIPVLKEHHSDVETYQLYAAVVHSGYSMDYGHYITYAREATETWYKFNDSFVYKTTLDDFFHLEPPETPYILFYERISNVILDVPDHKLELTTLSKHIQDLVAMDALTYDREVKSQCEKKLAQRGRLQNYTSNQSVSLFRQQRDNSDDDNPPPSSCREAVDIPPNRFLF